MPNRFLPALVLIFFAWLCIPPATAQNTTTVTIAGPTSVCPGCYGYRAIVTPSTGNPGSAPIQYLWTVTGPGGFSQTTTDSLPTFCFQSPGIYKITVSVLSANGIVVTSASLDVTVLNFLSVEIVSDNPADCNADSLSDPTVDNQFCDKVCPYSTVTYSLANLPQGPIGGAPPVITCRFRAPKTSW